MQLEALIASWNQWLKTSDELIQVLHEQTAAITLRNQPKVEELSLEITHFLAELSALDQQAMQNAAALSATRARTKDLLDKAETQELLAMANRVKVTARALNELIEKNRVLEETVRNTPIVHVKRTRRSRRMMLYGEAAAA